jgi:HK97 gp10 family phage protein
MSKSTQKNGFSAFSDDIKRMIRAIQDPREKRKACDEGGYIINEEAYRLAPHKTSTMRDNIYQAWIEKDECVEIGWSDDRFYGRFHEYGTYKMSPHPHMRPAMQNKGDEALDAMIKIYQKEME